MSELQENAAMKMPLGTCFAIGLAAIVLSPGSASADDFATPSLSPTELSSIYLSGGPSYGIAETNWRNYTQGAMAMGFNCHEIAKPAGTAGGAELVMRQVQCYDRVGNAYIVPGSDHLVRLN
jgi:hypothetical protein